MWGLCVGAVCEDAVACMGMGWEAGMCGDGLAYVWAVKEDLSGCLADVSSLKKMGRHCH